MYIIVLSHALYPTGMEVLEQQEDIQVSIADRSDTANILHDLQNADGFILRIGKVDRDMMEACPNLKVITRPGVGVDTIDVDAATEKGVPIVVTPGANVRSVAEQTLAMLFALSKNMLESHNETKKGNFSIRNKYAATELAGKAIGIVGFGNIGREVAKLCAALDMRVLVYDAYVGRAQAESSGYQYCAKLEELLRNSDAVTLHMPATEETRNILNEEAISNMKDGAFLINCARGDLIDEKALYDALQSGKLGGAAVDMLTEEPMNPNNPLFTLSNFLASPHMAALTKESAGKSAAMAVEGTLAVLRGEKWPHVFNPQAYAHPRWNNKQ